MGAVAWRVGVVAIGIATAGVVGWSGWTASLLHEGRAAEALTFSPGSATAQRLVAASLLQAGEVDRAQYLAREAMLAAPLSAGAIRVSILAAIERNDAEWAARALSTAGLLGWRDTGLQALLAGTAIAGENVHEAAIRADAFARISPQIDAGIALVRAVSTMRGGAAEVQARLVFDPEWRQSFMGSTGKLGEAQLAAHEAVLEGLEESGSPATRAELREYAVARVNAGQVARGRRLWGKLATGAGAAEDLLFDTRLRAVQDDAGPFEWARYRAPGVDFSDQEALERGGLVLQIDLPGGTSGDGNAILAQLTALSPGTYRFAVDSREQAPPGTLGGGGDRLRWIARCRPSGTVIPLDTDDAGKSGQRGRRIVAFAVPALGCDSQNIELLNPAMSGGSATSVQLHSVRIEPALVD